MQEWAIDGHVFQVVQGDITQQDTAAVVNAANKRLAPGGGVAGAIHREAGDELWEHCKTLGGCETGEAVITPGFQLAADRIIHTVGPVYDQHPDPEAALVDSYQNSLRLAEENELESVSFPSLSTGAFGYPLEQASRVALRTIRNQLSNTEHLKLVRMVLFGEDDYRTFLKAAEEVLGPPNSKG